MWRPGGIDRSTSLLLGLTVLSLVLLTVDLRASGAGVGSTLREGVQSVLSPVQRAVSTATKPFAGFVESLSDLFSVNADNERLRARVLELEQEVARLRSLENRVREFEALLGVAAPEGLETITAEVLAVGVSEFDHIRVISKGRNDGIGVGMPVIDEGGLVGRVVSVTATTAHVRLVVDPTESVAVRVERTGETGWLSGRGSGPMILELLNTDAAVLAGDILVTADGKYPSGIPVATVVRAARSEVGFSLRTEATPTAALSRIDLVHVLIYTQDSPGITVDDGTGRIPVVVPDDSGDRTSGESDDEPVTTTTTTLPDDQAP